MLLVRRHFLKSSLWQRGASWVALSSPSFQRNSQPFVLAPILFRSQFPKMTLRMTPAAPEPSWLEWWRPSTSSSSHPGYSILGSTAFISLCVCPTRPTAWPGEGSLSRKAHGVPESGLQSGKRGVRNHYGLDSPSVSGDLHIPGGRVAAH